MPLCGPFSTFFYSYCGIGLGFLVFGGIFSPKYSRLTPSGKQQQTSEIDKRGSVLIIKFQQKTHLNIHGVHPRETARNARTGNGRKCLCAHHQKALVLNPTGTSPPKHSWRIHPGKRQQVVRKLFGFQ